MSLATILKPMLSVGSLFGTIPLKLQNSNGIHFKTTLTRLAYLVLMVVVTVYHLIYTQDMVSLRQRSPKCELPYHNCSRRDLNDATSSGLLLIQSMNPETLIFMSLGAHWTSFFKIRTMFPKLIERLEFVDQRLSPLLPENLRKLNYYRPAITFAIFLAVPLPLFVLYIWRNHHNISIAVWIFGLVVHNLVSYSCELQLITFLQFLRSQFKIINNALLASSLGVSIRPKLLNLRKPAKVGPVELKGPLSLWQISMLHDCYIELSYCWYLLNHIYAVQVVLSMSGCFVKALFNVYTLMLGTSLDGREKTDAEILTSVMWLSFYLLRFCTLAVSASKAADEANRTKSKVALVIIQRYDEVVCEELEIFWMNAFTREAKFSACGLFHLNSPLIIKACSTCITYLVLLIQFKPQMGLS